LVGWSVGRLVGWSVGRLVGWSVGRSVDRSVDGWWLVFDWLFASLVSWPVNMDFVPFLWK